MTRSYTLEYWQDGDWYVGKVKELPGVFSQGRTLGELAENVQDAYAMMVQSSGTTKRKNVSTMEIGLEA